MTTTTTATLPNPRETWHEIRRAMTTVQTLPAIDLPGHTIPERRCIIRAGNVTDALARARSVKVARGLAPARDAMARTWAELSAANRAMPPASIEARVRGYVARKFSAEIARRGGDTEIRTEHGAAGLIVADRRNGYTLLRAEGWRYYSRRAPQRRAVLCYLCGTDDNGLWAVRVRDCTTVSAALAQIEPAEVRKAREAGRGVLRQGDVYAIETRRRGVDTAGLAGANHRYDAEHRAVIHTPDDGAAHGAVPIPAEWRGAKFVRQNGLGMGRGALSRDAAAD